MQLIFNVHFSMPHQQGYHHHYCVHRHEDDREADGIIPVGSKQHVERNHRSGEQHAYCCHNEVEVYEMLR